MKKCVRVTAQNIDEYLEKYFVLVCSIRNSRIKAKKLAIIEVLCCLYPLQGIFIINGPLGDVKGLISFFILKEHKERLPSYLKNLGYCNKFYVLDFDNPELESTCDIHSKNPLIWKKRKFSIRPFYKQSQKVYKQQSPHNRHFRIVGSDNVIRDVYGYRGDGSEKGRRALPVEDARCLVNLALPSKVKTMIDPFAGAGGIVYQAKYINKNIEVFSVDIDKSLEPGLVLYGSNHYIGNSAEINLDTHIFDALITEVPFTLDALDDICNTLINFDRHLSQSGRVVIMLSKNQLDVVKKCIKKLNWHIIMSYLVNRKGTAVVVMVCAKSYELYKQVTSIMEVINYIY